MVPPNVPPESVILKLKVSILTPFVIVTKYPLVEMLIPLMSVPPDDAVTFVYVAVGNEF
jgi:hypothetical protein